MTVAENLKIIKTHPLFLKHNSLKQQGRCAIYLPEFIGLELNLCSVLKIVAIINLNQLVSFNHKPVEIQTCLGIVIT